MKKSGLGLKLGKGLSAGGKGLRLSGDGMTLSGDGMTLSGTGMRLGSGMSLGGSCEFCGHGNEMFLLEGQNMGTKIHKKSSKVQM